MPSGPHPGSSVPPGAKPFGRSPGTWLLALLVLMLVLIGAGGLLQFDRQTVRARQAAEESMAHMAALKSGQITQWMRERRADAETARDQPLAWHVLHKPGNPEAREELLQWMDRVQEAYGFSGMALFDAAGALHLHAANGEIRWQDAATVADFSAHAMDAVRAGEVVFLDLHRLPDQSIHMAFAVPVSPPSRGGLTAAGALVFSIDPHKFLYPLIQRWPTPSTSAETLLVRREGDEVVFLSELRHRPGTALVQRLPVQSSTGMPAAKAVQGHDGPTEGLDYRGIPVVSAASRIDGTPWFIVAKVDQQEIFDPLRRQAWSIGQLALLLALLASLGVGLVWREQKLLSSRQAEAALARYARELEQSRAELAEDRRRLSDILEGTNVGTWEWKVPSGEVVVNERWAQIVGCSLEELRPVSIDSFRARTHPDDVAAAGVLLQKHFSGALPFYRCESRVRHKDGHWVWVLDRGRVSSWTQDGQPLLMSGTRQDISGAKQDALEAARKTVSVSRVGAYVPATRPTAAMSGSRLAFA